MSPNANAKGAGSNWTSFAESPFPWERDALEFVRERFPANEPWRAWSLFEFIALDGSVNEVDLLVFAPFGFFLIEIKSRPGRLSGDAGTWTWENGGKLTTTDNPLKLANLKAKKLADLLKHQSATRRGGRVPFIEPLIFLSAPNLQCDLSGTGRLRVCLRDREGAARPGIMSDTARPGIMSAIQQRHCPGLESLPGREQLNRPTAKIVARAIEQAGIRQSNRQRRVSDYSLEQQIDEGKGFQDWQANHVTLPDTKRRIRMYPIHKEVTPDARRTRERAAIREFQLIENLQHPSILRAMQFTEHELGPAIIFEHDPAAIRLDHFLSQRDRTLTLSTRLDLVRQLAEVMQFVHKKRVVHRSLSPRSILVLDAATAKPRLKVFNWYAGYRAAAESDGSTGSASGRALTATSHVGLLVDDPTTAYMAPEIFADGESLGEHLDVFSLGAVAYHILSGHPPAADAMELAAAIRTTRGLQLSGVLNGANEPLCELIQYSTHPDVSNRLDTVSEFLSLLDDAENQLTSPGEEYALNPADAVAGDLLPGGLRVERRIGQGSCATALLVTRGAASDSTHAERFILKVASTTEHNDRLRDEAAALARLADDRDHRIVGFIEALEIGDYAGFLMRPVFADSDNKRIETLGSRIRKEGRLHIDLLQRFGEDLIDVVRHLDKQGVSHRDIKPDNMAVGRVTKDHTLQIVLFDFSLTSVAPENIRAGTVGYLDPMLPLRRPPPRYDSYAERYAVAATLHEMATGTLPKWGDGRSDPSQITAEITIDADLFDTDLREKLAAFFKRAFRRDIAERFDNAEQMLFEWKACFAGLAASPLTDDQDSDEELTRILAPAMLQSPIASLGLGTRAANALDRANVLTVRDLLRFNRLALERMRGVGAKTRREITSAVRILRDRLVPHGTSLEDPTQQAPATDVPTETVIDQEPSVAVDPETLSIEAIAGRLLAAGQPSTQGAGGRRVVECILGRNTTIPEPWPTQTAMATEAGVTPGRVSQIVGKLLSKSLKDSVITIVRGQLAELVEAHGGVATAAEIASCLLAARGSEEPPASGLRSAIGIVRIAVETENLLAEPRLTLRRENEMMLVGTSVELADYAIRLGHAADRLATEEPLASPGLVMERLRSVVPPAGTMLPDPRLIRLAASASHNAAVSSRLELYPRGMDSLRALKLSLGAVAGVRELTDDQIRERVTSRYPDACLLPARPKLDELLRAAGLELHFDSAAAGGQGAFIAPVFERPSMTSGSTFLPRYQTAVGASPQPATPEFADARAFEDRLKRALQAGSFLQMVVTPREYERAAEEFCRRFGVVRVDVEQVVIDALRETAGSLGVDWNLVVAADSDSDGPDWQNLRQLVERARLLISERLFQPGATPLLVYPDILVRYGLKSLLAELQQRIGTAHGPQGVWLLVPGGSIVQIDRQPVGVPGQQGIVPDSWIQNLHRAPRSLATTS